MTGPIKPGEVLSRKVAAIPEEVFEVFNALIAEKWDGYQAIVIQEDIGKRIAVALKIPITEVFARHFLDVEDLYRRAGWKVEYDKPGYNETYEAKFIFRKK